MVDAAEEATRVSVNCADRSKNLLVAAKMSSSAELKVGYTQFITLPSVPLENISEHT